MTVSFIGAVKENPCPTCPFCAPGFFPDFLRKLVGLGFARPSDDGGLELLLEFLFKETLINSQKI